MTFTSSESDKTSDTSLTALLNFCFTNPIQCNSIRFIRLTLMFVRRTNCTHEFVFLCNVFFPLFPVRVLFLLLFVNNVLQIVCSMLHVMFWSKKKSKSLICFWIHPFSCVESMPLLHLCYTLNAIQITQAVTSYEHHHVWDEFILYTVHTLWISYGACVFQFFVCKQVAVFPLGFNSMCTEHWKKNS